MRVLFLSDTHLGFDEPARPRVVRRRRGADFTESYARALAPALAGEVDVVLHGGDLLYRSRVPAGLVERALAPLRRIADQGVPVMIVPGNHERGRIPYPLLARHPRLHVFDRPRTFDLESGGVRVAFSGFPYARDVRRRFPELLAAAEVDRPAGPPAHLAVLCVHHAVEGATCGPGDFTFTTGGDVIRRADLPARLAVVLSGHIHRHQVLRRAGRPAVVYAGSIERTSFAEAQETKGTVRLDLDARGVVRIAFVPLETRPMAVRTLALGDVTVDVARRRVADALAATPEDAVVQLRATGGPGPATAWLTAAALRALSGGRDVRLVASWAPRRAARPVRPERGGLEREPAAQLPLFGR